MSHDEDTRADGGELIPGEPGPEEGRSLRSQADREPSLQQLIELERRRIDRDNRRTEVQAKALESQTIRTSASSNSRRKDSG